LRATRRAALRRRAAMILLLTSPAHWAGFGVAQEPEALTERAPAERGEAIVEERVCRACHRIGTEGMSIGPDLNQVTLRRSEEWLRRWLVDPPALKAGTLMPIYSWTEDELDAVIDYLAQYRRPVNGTEILAGAGVGIEGGEALVNAYQCWACHAIEGQLGRPIYPDLGTVQEQRTPEWEKAWLRDPQAVKPGTFMPTFDFSAAEVEAITRYLYRSPRPTRRARRSP